MSKPDKSYWLGASVLFCRCLAGFFFVLSCFVALRWFQAEGFGGGKNAAAFWNWIWDDKNKDQFEPLIALLGLLGVPFSLAAAAALNKLKQQSAESPEGGARGGAGGEEWERIRPKLINVVRHDWVKGHLENNLAQKAWIHLGVEKAPDESLLAPEIAVEPEQRRELIQEDSLLRLFDENGGRLLILGEPGGGKTITLVKLCELLLKRAEGDPAAPVPIGLRLASWAVGRLPFDQWLARELKERNLGSPSILWALQEDRVTLLLDGLDEVAPDARADCLAAIEAYRQTRTVSLVVCCRREEYEALPDSFGRIRAVRILPLQAGQIEAYLRAIGKRADALRDLLAKNAELRELATTPLMLSILARIYREGESITDLPADAPTEQWRDVIFERYVRIMFARKGYDPSKTLVARGQAIHFLQQIARNMRQWNEPVLYLERIHIGWVRKRWFGILVLAVVWISVCLALAILSSFNAGNHGSLGPRLVVLAVVTGTVPALLFGLDSSPALLPGTARLRWNWATGLGTAAALGLLCLFLGAFRGFILLGSVKVEEILSFSLIGSLTGFLFGSVDWDNPIEPATPYEGVTKSLQFGMLAGAFLGVLAGSLVGVLGARSAGFFSNPLSVAGMGFVVGFGVLGGLGVLSLAIVRIVLAFEGRLPFPFRTKRLIAFLDAMGDLILLRRVGGGWIFAHRLLLEYLADEPFGLNPKAIEGRLREQ